VLAVRGGVGVDEHSLRHVGADSNGDRRRRRSHVHRIAQLEQRGRAGAGRVGSGQYRWRLARVQRPRHPAGNPRPPPPVSLSSSYYNIFGILFTL